VWVDNKVANKTIKLFIFLSSALPKLGDVAVFSILIVIFAKNEVFINGLDRQINGCEFNWPYPVQN
jgi:hypothetical protein